MNKLNYLQYAIVLFASIAVIGHTKEYSLAIAVAFPIHWMHLKNKRIRELEKALELNREFWNKAQSVEGLGIELVYNMREVCDSAMLNKE